MRQKWRHRLVGLNQNDCGYGVSLHIEAVDALRHSIVENLEVFLLQVVNKPTRRIKHGNGRSNQRRLNSDLSEFLLGLQVLGGLLLGCRKYWSLTCHSLLSARHARSAHRSEKNDKGHDEDDR